MSSMSSQASSASSARRRPASEASAQRAISVFPRASALVGISSAPPLPAAGLAGCRADCCERAVGERLCLVAAVACPLAGEAAQGGADAFRGGRGVVAGGPVGGGDPGRVGADGGDARAPVGAIGEVGGDGFWPGGEGRLPARECPGLELADRAGVGAFGRLGVGGAEGLADELAEPGELGAGPRVRRCGVHALTSLSVR